MTGSRYTSIILIIYKPSLTFREVTVHPADIKAALIKSGYTLTKVAHATQVSQPLISQVVHGRITSARVAQFIAQATGLPLEQLWPGRYCFSARNAHGRVTVNCTRRKALTPKATV